MPFSLIKQYWNSYSENDDFDDLFEADEIKERDDDDEFMRSKFVNQLNANI